MVKIVKNMKKSFLNLFESVKSCGGSSPKDAKEYDGETHIKAQSKVQGMGVKRARELTSPGKPEAPPPQTQHEAI